MEALVQVPCDSYILACPMDSVADFSPLAEQRGFSVFPGSKEDVLARYAAAIRAYKPDRIIRATGDNPFVFADAAALINQEALERGADYAGFAGLPHGAGVESVAAEALLRADREAAAGYEREHVCPYLYNHPELFRLHRPLAPFIWQDNPLGALRVTVDTPADYDHAQALYGFLSADTARFPENRRYHGQIIIETYRKLLGTQEKK
jgi:spore coat polysaccharide biosynthesis protein SpsF